MGNIFSVSFSTQDITGRCCDCTAAQANYICKLEENLVTLRTGLQKLRELRNDVSRRVDVAERQQMKCLDQVQGWFSRVEAMENEVIQLIGDGAETMGEKRLCCSCYPKHYISSYKLGKKVVRKIQQLATLITDGWFPVVADPLPPAPVEALPIGPTVGLESTFNKIWRFIGEEHVGFIIGFKIFNDSISLNISSLQNVELLTWLRFGDFDSLREIKFNCAGKSSNLSSKVESFHGLGTVYILRCRVLKNLTWLTFAPNLKFLTVEECGEMEEVIGKCAEDGGNMSPFGKLMRLKIILSSRTEECVSESPAISLPRKDFCGRLSKVEEAATQLQQCQRK